MPTVYFYDFAQFSSIDPDLLNPFFDEIFSGKNGSELTTGDSPKISNFDVTDTNDAADDIALFQNTTEDVTVNGNTYFSGSSFDIGYYLLVDTDGDGVADVTLFSLQLQNNTVGFISNAKLPANTTLTVVGGGDIGDIRYADMATCFTDGALILTPEGEKRVEDLKSGDLVSVPGAKAQPIRWIGSQKISSARLAEEAALRPIRIEAGALGNGLPREDLIVSRQHRILIASAIVERMFEASEILVPAKDLLGLPGVSEVEDLAPVTYHHIALDHHEVIVANGVQTESLYFGEEGMNSLPMAHQVELAAIFPDLRALIEADNAARPLQKGKVVRTAIERHIKNDKALCA